MSDRIDDLLRIDNEGNNKNTADFSKSLKRSMNEQIYKRAIATVICFSLIVTVLYFAVSKMFDIACYDPTEEKGLCEGYDKHNPDDFDLLFCEYVGLVIPGYVIYPVSEENEISMGFGKYKYTYGIFNVLENANIGEVNSELIIDKNHWKMGENSVGFVSAKGKFHDSNSMNNNYDISMKISSNKEMVEEIRNLPDSAIILANVSFENEKTADGAVDFMRKHSDSNVEWIAVDDSNSSNSGITTGISFSTPGSWYDISEEAKEEYPNLLAVNSDFIDTETGIGLGGEELKNKYLSTLKLLLDHEEFVKVFKFNDYSFEEMHKQYDRVSDGFFWVEGMQMTVTKQALLDMIDNNEIQYLSIDDVKLSSWSK